MGVMEFGPPGPPPLPADSAAPAHWLTSRIATFGDPHVTAVAGTGWPAYGRVMHPLDDAPGGQRWSDVARERGRGVHAAVQWWEIAGDDDDPRRASGRSSPGDPIEGTLVPPALAALCGVLADQTSTPERCWFAVWNGWGWQHSGATAIITATSATAHEGPTIASTMLSAFGDISANVGVPESADQPEHRDDAGVVPWTLDLQAPVFELPGRQYLLFAGPIGAALSIGWWVTPTSFIAQSPSLMWPDNHAWCVATDVDFDSTLIGGNLETINAILANPHLEAWQIDPESTWRRTPTATTPDNC